MLDLRTPSGSFFLMVGLILCVMGVAAPSHAALTEANVNLYGGAAMAVFGGVLLFLARRRA